MRKLISWLSRSAWLRRAVQRLRLHDLGNAWLRRFPLTKRLPGSGVIYRATRLESIPLAVEMFEKGKLYDASLLPAGFTTFADLGCNVGYFTCWLAHLAATAPSPTNPVAADVSPLHLPGGGIRADLRRLLRGFRGSTREQAREILSPSRGDGSKASRALRGLMLDANPAAVEEARWHAQANGMQEVFGLHGIVGEGQPGDVAEFYLYESNICSTAQVPDTVKLGLKGKWEKIRVPCISLEQHWRQHFGDARCHLLKVDIEGSELNFLKAEPTFLRRCDAVLVEWHKWRVALEELRSFLASQGFAYVKTVEENDQMGTAFFRRAEGAPQPNPCS